MKTLIFDVMLNEQYIHTFKYKYNPLFPIEEEELRKFVEERLPTLKGKNFKILFWTIMFRVNIIPVMEYV